MIGFFKSKPFNTSEMSKDDLFVSLVFYVAEVAEANLFSCHLSNFRPLYLLKWMLFATFAADFSKEVIII